MGILNDLKNKVEKLGDKAREGFDDARDKAGDLLDDARDKAGDLLDDAKERMGHREDDASPLSESSDVGPDTTSTDAVQPGYVTAEDDVTGTAADESSLTDDLADDDEPGDPDAGGADVVVEEELLVAEPTGATDVVPPAVAELDPVDIDAAEVDSPALAEDDDAADLPAEPDVPEPAVAEPAVTEPAVAEPAVETDVDPYEEPLTETIGDEIASALVDSEAVARAVGSTSDERDPQS